HLYKHGTDAFPVSLERTSAAEPAYLYPIWFILATMASPLLRRRHPVLPYFETWLRLYSDDTRYRVYFNGRHLPPLLQGLAGSPSTSRSLAPLLLQQPSFAFTSRGLASPLLRRCQTQLS
ncbi:hypothetical protein CDV31_013566, partial [Fusarium ambrosium]